MSQNLVSMQITKEQRDTVLALIAQILQILTGLIAGLQPDERKALTNMGAGSDRFVRIVHLALQQNPDIVPRNLNIEEFTRDLEALDMLAPILSALQQLLTRIEDTRTAIGSDLMVAANRGYALMQANGNYEGMEEALKEASYRYAKNRRKNPAPEGEK